MTPCRSYRASSKHGSGAASSLVSTFHLIKDVQKKFRAREQERREMEVGERGGGMGGRKGRVKEGGEGEGEGKGRGRGRGSEGKCR